MPPKKQQPQLPTAAEVEDAVVDLNRTKYRFGAQIGQGGFGTVHLANLDNGTRVTAANAQFVAKVESEVSGGLFSELKCFQNAQLVGWNTSEVEKWKKAHKLKHLGLPLMHACTTTTIKDKPCRVMVLDRLGESVFSKTKSLGDKSLAEGTAMRMAAEVLDAVEYLHAKGYVHSDIKGANICTTVDGEHVALIDFGSADRFMKGDGHAPFMPSPAKHDGTLKYTCIDAHLGTQCSRRGDVEILGYQMLDWVGSLPWRADADNATPKNIKNAAETVAKLKCAYNPTQNAKGTPKAQAKANATRLVADVLGSKTSKCSDELIAYMEHVFMLAYDEEPNYKLLRDILTKGASKAGDKGGKLVFQPSTPGKGGRKSASTGASPAASPKKSASGKSDKVPPLAKLPLKHTPPKAKGSSASSSPKAKVAPQSQSPSPVKRGRSKKAPTVVLSDSEGEEAAAEPVVVAAPKAAKTAKAAPKVATKATKRKSAEEAEEAAEVVAVVEAKAPATKRPAAAAAVRGRPKTPEAPVTASPKKASPADKKKAAGSKAVSPTTLARRHARLTGK